MGKGITRDDARRVKDWLKGHGHDGARVDKIKGSAGAELRRGVAELHGITPAEYAAAGGKA